ncbi:MULTISPECIES: zf-HC2 domain-containing protein [Gordonia]|jgi:predicted anti-sigma-YlaC factor YlaD|uniref:zf-HC2 domain-containing protein n=1 Tax=Gordonia oleivorans TaxID=3156618 RepID=UPI003CCDC1C5
MRCEVAREALSARTDGERETVPSVRVDEHVAGCADCTEFAAALAAIALPQIREPLRVVGSDTGPDLVERMLAARAEQPAPSESDRESRSGAWWIAAGGGAFVSGALAVTLVLTHGSVIVIALFVIAVVATVGLTVRARR